MLLKKLFQSSHMRHLPKMDKHDKGYEIQKFIRVMKLVTPELYLGIWEYIISSLLSFYEVTCLMGHSKNLDTLISTVVSSKTIHAVPACDHLSVEGYWGLDFWGSYYLLPDNTRKENYRHNSKEYYNQKTLMKFASFLRSRQLKFKELILQEPSDSTPAPPKNAFSISLNVSCTQELNTVIKSAKTIKWFPVYASGLNPSYKKYLSNTTYLKLDILKPVGFASLPDLPQLREICLVYSGILTSTNVMLATTLLEHFPTVKLIVFGMWSLKRYNRNNISNLTERTILLLDTFDSSLEQVLELANIPNLNIEIGEFRLSERATSLLAGAHYRVILDSIKSISFVLSNETQEEYFQLFDNLKQMHTLKVHLYGYKNNGIKPIDMYGTSIKTLIIKPFECSTISTSIPILNFNFQRLEKLEDISVSQVQIYPDVFMTLPNKRLNCINLYDIINNKYQEIIAIPKQFKNICIHRVGYPNSPHFSFSRRIGDPLFVEFCEPSKATTVERIKDFEKTIRFHINRNDKVFLNELITHIIPSLSGDFKKLNLMNNGCCHNIELVQIGPQPSLDPHITHECFSISWLRNIGNFESKEYHRSKRILKIPVIQGSNNINKEQLSTIVGIAVVKLFMELSCHQSKLIGAVEDDGHVIETDSIPVRLSLRDHLNSVFCEVYSGEFQIE